MTGPRDGYDSALTAIRNGAENLAVALATWQARDDTKPDAHARRAANSAIDAVDAMLRELHAIRQLLISEVQQADRATAARVDALLADRDQASRGHPAPGDTKALRGKDSPDNPVAYGAPVTCPRYVPGEVITSAVQGTNADLLRQAAKLWIRPEDKLIDVTAGNGTFWPALTSSLCAAISGCCPGLASSRTAVSCPTRTPVWTLVAFDPPYQPVHGQTERSFGVGRSYGQTDGPGPVLQTSNDVLGLYEAGIAECARVLVPGTGRLLVKCQDMTYNHRLHLVSLDVLRLMTAAGIDLADHFVLANKSRMPQPTQRQQRAHRAHSYLIVGVKARQRITRLPGRRPGSVWSCGITRAASTGSFTGPR